MRCRTTDRKKESEVVLGECFIQIWMCFLEMGEVGCSKGLTCRQLFVSDWILKWENMVSIYLKCSPGEWCFEAVNTFPLREILYRKKAQACWNFSKGHTMKGEVKISGGFREVGLEIHILWYQRILGKPIKMVGVGVLSHDMNWSRRNIVDDTVEHVSIINSSKCPCINRWTEKTVF